MVAEELHRQGAVVHVCDVSVEALATYPAAFGKTFKADVADSLQVADMMKVISQEHGHLDILVNNAGISGPTQPVQDIDITDWKRTLAVDLDGVFFTTKYAIPLLKLAKGATIINMSSNAGLGGLPLRSPYVAAKWAIVGLTKTWAMELGKAGITVNALCPGSVGGERIDRVIQQDAAERGVDSEDVRDVYKRQSSLRRFVEAEDIANMVSYLVSDLGRNISGQAIAIDGHTETMGNWLDQ